MKGKKENHLYPVKGKNGSVQENNSVNGGMPRFGHPTKITCKTIKLKLFIINFHTS